MIFTRLLEESEGALLWVNVLPIGEFYDPRYGEVKITKKLIKEMEANFRNNFPHYAPPVNIGHDDDLGAYGIIVAVEAKEDGLWALLELTPEGAELVKKEKFRYLSAEYTESYMDKETGKDVGAVLLGVALTNRPAHPKMKEISLQEVENVKYKFMILDPPDFPLDLDSPWSWDWAEDANQIVEKFGWEGLAKCCAYVDVENFEKGESGFPENKNAYKLPFAKIKNGKLTIFWSGVRSAMAALLGARGGVDIPREDKKKVYEKLAELYKRFEKEPPEFHYEEVKDVDETKIKKMEETIKELADENEKLKKELENIRKEKTTLAVENWARDWIRKGVKPAVIEKIKKKVLEDPTQVEFFDSVLLELADEKHFKQIGEEEKSPIEIAVEKAKRTAKAIWGGD